jgi:hypothetical protein
MLRKRLKNPCPFCGGTLKYNLCIYTSGVYSPHLEAECLICHTRIAWPTKAGATKIKDLLEIAERRAPCDPECSRKAAATVAAWRLSSKQKEERA